jgi:hypothetical protein
MHHSRTESILATGADIPDTIPVFRIFAQEVLTKIHGHHWHEQTDDWFIWEGYPETKGRSDWEKTNLHFHTTLAGSKVAKVPLSQMIEFCEAASQKIGFRMFGWNPGVNVQVVRNLEHWRSYILKNQRDHLLGYGGFSLMSDNVPRLEFDEQGRVKMA